MNPLELFFTSVECIIYYNKELHVVQTRWNGIYVSGDELHKILDSIIELMQIKKTGIVLADARDMKIIASDDQKWIVDDWYPRALNAGFSHEALVVSANTFNELTIKKIVTEYDDHKIKTGYFTTVEEAVEWIRELKSKS
ncbi:MAG: hypothetical protein NT126_11080 [Bacteroidetes bacterium]|nr:hypothetical protein [Bacteroidota bacterium]